MKVDWQTGDHAMCVWTRRNDGSGLERGRVYSVADVLDDGRGLTLSDHPTPEGYRGFSAGRFHRIPKGMTYASSTQGLI